MNTAVVVRTGWRLARRGIWAGGRPRRGLLPVVLSLFLAGAFSLTFTLIFGTLASAGATDEMRARALGWAFTFAILLLALGDVLAVVSAAATAPDLERLLTAPLGPRQLLAIKFVDTLPRTLGPVLAIALPASLAFAWTGDGVPFASLAVALCTLWAVPLGLGSALALPLLKVAPARRLRESLAVLATLAFVGGWLANTFWMPRLVASTGPSAGLRALPPLPLWSPATWAADAVARAGERSLEAFAACVAASAAALLLAFTSAGRLLAQLQSDAAAIPGRRVRSAPRRARTLTGAFLRRDAALFARDWPVLLDLVARVALWTLLPLAILPLSPLPRPELVRDMLVGLTLSLGNDVAARALPLERHALAWARLSPVGGVRWVHRRALGVAVLGAGALLLGAGVCGFALRLSALEALDAFAFALPAAASALGMGLVVGATLGDPEWRDPRAMLGVGGRFVCALSMLAQGSLWVAASHAIGPSSVSPGLLVLFALTGGLWAWALLGVCARVIERREYTAR